MFSIENLTNNIADKITLELGLDNDRKEIIAYGTFALLHTMLSIFLVVIFGLLFGVWLEALIISLAGSILRKYSGGVHASTPGICAFAGAIIIIGIALLISFAIAPSINLIIVILLGLLTFAYSYYLIFKLAPIDSAAKPIKTEKKRKRMKKGSILILNVYMLIVALNIIMYINTYEKCFLVISLCIYGGTAWQAFTLTNAGHLIFRKVDAFLNHILINKRGEK